ncbi:Arabinose efflux permease [Desulfitobacterium hafniense]|uniref:Arabinose efflux permease n=1 Tax=Desulfitobacterium hafniense TaxID=49338 RepID=A0A098B766_DESHA|nr:MFS transporter [Desulfitobacterium hafniense]CDX04187.1 Arabinose efflux permease [Desulfitobacterium hafniense]
MSLNLDTGKSTRTVPQYQNYLFVAIVIMFTAVSAAANQFKVPTIMGDLAQSMNMSVSSATWLMSIFTFVGIFLAVPAGSLVQKFGPKMMVVTAVALIGIGSIIGSLATTGTMLIFSRAIEGVGFIFAATAGPTAMSRYVEPSKMGTAMGIWACWVAIGQILAFTLTPMLITSMSWNTIWIIFAVFAIVMALVLQFTINGSMGNVVESSGPAVKFSDVFKKKNLWLLCLSFSTFNLAFMALLSFVPTYLEQSGMMTKSGAAFVCTVPMILSIACSIIFGKLSDMLHTHKKLLIVALAALIPALALMFSSSVSMVWIGGIFLGLIAMGVPAMVLSSVGEVVESPELVGPGMGLVMVFQNLGMFIGTAIFMPIAGMFGGNMTMAAYSMIAFAVLGIILALMAKFK